MRALVRRVRTLVDVAELWGLALPGVKPNLVRCLSMSHYFSRQRLKLPKVARFLRALKRRLQPGLGGPICCPGVGYFQTQVAPRAVHLAPTGGPPSPPRAVTHRTAANALNTH